MVAQRERVNRRGDPRAVAGRCPSEAFVRVAREMFLASGFTTQYSGIPFCRYSVRFVW